ncbi:hypothetical protein CVT24_003032 [Panaeolus cyanescens]|uniref:DUF2461 domain-containing protein n=1 Tax=Panaeolus cyanescens TaxID=181874 RepID=A0A409VFP2_9AGAR|nr:hypothetical protein CVT24_003032 [Panaeolus cyanescens]
MVATRRRKAATAVKSAYFEDAMDVDEASGQDSDSGSETSNYGGKRKRGSGSTSARRSTGRQAKKARVDDVEYAQEGSSKSRKVYDSDDLDDDSDDEKVSAKKSGSARAPKKSSSRKQKRSTAVDEDYDMELEEGQQVVGVVVKAPTTGRVPPGQISRNTFNFLSKLRDPKCNDRGWFKLNEPVYRVAETEWKDFVEAFTDVLVEVDPQIPHLPPKDVIHRIYRDMRFSNDKTPYKTGLSASFSRSGRKGIFAHFKPGNQSIIAGGSWCPGRQELATIRANIARNSRRLRRVISDPEFVRYFGEPHPHPNGERQNIFGHEDELKVAPKGVDKDHKDIDLLKCRSFAVVHRFTDSEVFDPDFKEKLGQVASVLRPLVHCLNDYMTVENADDDDDDDDDDAVDEDD